MLSVIIPVHNEEENVEVLVKEIRSFVPDAEIIFVDDGSTDHTFDRLLMLKVKVVKLRKNFGQSAAWLAGFDHASGDVIVTLDGDGQNDPKDIPKLLKKLDEGFDCVSGWRKNRKDKLWVRLFSRCSNFVRHLLINDTINDSGCSLKAYRRECLQNLELFGEMHRYIVSLVRLKGFKIGEVIVNHRERKAGKTKYGVYKVVKGFLDIWSVWFWMKFASRPMHLFGVIGLGLFFFGFVSGTYSAYLKIFQHVDLSDTFLPIVAIFSVLLGVQLFVLGILSDIMIKTYHVGKKSYQVEKIVE